MMWEASPVAHVQAVVAPTLLTLGMKDRRVPYSQGLEWGHALESQGVEVKMLVYPEDTHALDKCATEADCAVHISLWLRRHL
jgi:acylaminoacyl-peptidase